MNPSWISWMSYLLESSHSDFASGIVHAFYVPFARHATVKRRRFS